MKTTNMEIGAGIMLMLLEPTIQQSYGVVGLIGFFLLTIGLRVDKSAVATALVALFVLAMLPA